MDVVMNIAGISEVLRHDLWRHGIRVSLGCPGGVNTGQVNTVQIIGVDADKPSVVALRQRFQRHAIKPKQAAAAMLMRWLNQQLHKAVS